MNKTTHRERCETHIVDFYQRYPRYDRVSLLSALGDAAALCDSISLDILAKHTSRGKTTKQGRLLGATVKEAADALWAMRDKIPADVKETPDARNDRQEAVASPRRDAMARVSAATRNGVSDRARTAMAVRADRRAMVAPSAPRCCMGEQ